MPPYKTLFQEQPFSSRNGCCCSCMIGIVCAYIYNLIIILTLMSLLVPEESKMPHLP